MANQLNLWSTVPTHRHFDLVNDIDGQLSVYTDLRGNDLLANALLNKGTSFTGAERDRFGLCELLPARETTLDEQVAQAWASVSMLASDDDKHRYLRDLQDRNETLFYALLLEHIEEVLPLIYTPAVAQAVRHYSADFRRPRGVYFGGSRASLDGVDMNEVGVICATDGSAVLGIGDQGVGGIEIAVGKLSIYVAAGGLRPDAVLPVVLDVGRNNPEMRGSQRYLGNNRPRTQGPAYFELLDRFVEQVGTRFPGAILQWEDLAKDNAFASLERYRDVVPSFNDDIQGTGAAALAGMLSASRLTQTRLTDHRFLIYGAGAGGIGVAWALTEGLRREGLSNLDARSRVLVVDSKGLLVEGREMEAFKRAFAQLRVTVEGWETDLPTMSLVDVIREAQVTSLIGLSGQAGAFSEDVVAAVAANADRPLVFPLSNPTASAEASPNDLLRWTGGRAVVATGSPFGNVAHDGQMYSVAQGNNAFIFPGLGLGSRIAGARMITDRMVLAAAYALAEYTGSAGMHVFPPIEEIRTVATSVAAAVARQAIVDDVATSATHFRTEINELTAAIASQMWVPHYLPYVRSS